MSCLQVTRDLVGASLVAHSVSQGATCSRTLPKRGIVAALLAPGIGQAVTEKEEKIQAFWASS